MSRACEERTRVEAGANQESEAQLCSRAESPRSNGGSHGAQAGLCCRQTARRQESKLLGRTRRCRAGCRGACVWAAREGRTLSRRSERRASRSFRRLSTRAKARSRAHRAGSKLAGTQRGKGTDGLVFHEEARKENDDPPRAIAPFSNQARLPRPRRRAVVLARVVVGDPRRVGMGVSARERVERRVGRRVLLRAGERVRATSAVTADSSSVRGGGAHL